MVVHNQLQLACWDVQVAVCSKSACMDCTPLLSAKHLPDGPAQAERCELRE